VKDKEFELEMSWICAESNYQHQLVPKDVLQAAEDYAKKALAEEEMEQD
jgi:20S proteasome subunit alpha 7